MNRSHRPALPASRSSRPTGRWWTSTRSPRGRPGASNNDINSVLTIISVIVTGEKTWCAPRRKRVVNRREERQQHHHHHRLYYSNQTSTTSTTDANNSATTTIALVRPLFAGSAPMRSSFSWSMSSRRRMLSSSSTSTAAQRSSPWPTASRNRRLSPRSRPQPPSLRLAAGVTSRSPLSPGCSPPLPPPPPRHRATWRR